MTLHDIRRLIAEDFAAVDRTIRARLTSDVALVEKVGQYIVAGGGKRLRPILVLLAARACGYRGDRHVLLAAVVEFIHTATLLHDDVVDASTLRRGRETANAVFGNAASVLVGDFLYSRAFQMMVEAGDFEIMRVMADATNAIAAGEVMQLMNCHDPDVSEERYLAVIERKTAKLFEAGAEIAALVAGAAPAQRAALARYGLQIGKAFQLVDDVLDYGADSAELGKNVGDDLAEGKPTLPLIQAMKAGDERQRRLIREAIERGDRARLTAVLDAIRATGALDYTRAAARREAALARAELDVLPDSPYRQALAALADIAVERDR
ncbi:MAG TPA: octaprenyl diphosphate synthase [Gammaproteobacteria bacterium]|nr:octaprenyl diphosphate synthase [Gammaproteobacteria bacterium]